MRTAYCSGPLFELDAAAGLLELGLELVALFAVDALLHGLRRLVDERLRLLEAEPGSGANRLDHLDLLVTGCGEHDVDRARLLLAGPVGSRAAAGRRRGRRSNGGRRDAELLLERLDSLRELEHRDALELLDPLFGTYLRHVSLAPGFVVLQVSWVGVAV